MKIFLTGSTGFIGSHLLNELLTCGYEVTALRRNKDSVPRININHNINWIEGALDDIPAEKLNGIDVLMHLASHSVQFPFDELNPCIKNNVLKPLQLFDNAICSGVRKFIIAGSCVEYGLSGENYEFIPADAKLIPSNTYATSKAMSYLAFKQFFSDKKALVHYHRLFHVFGEGQQSERLWPYLKYAAQNGQDVDLTKGEQVFDFINVNDVAKKFIESAKIANYNNGSEFLTYNMGSGNPISIRDFSEFWWKKWNASGKLKFGAKDYRKNEIMRYVPLVSEPNKNL